MFSNISTKIKSMFPAIGGNIDVSYYRGATLMFPTKGSNFDMEYESKIYINCYHAVHVFEDFMSITNLVLGVKYPNSDHENIKNS